MPKPRYKTKNWKQHNQSLIKRGSLTFWIDEEATHEWEEDKQGKRGRPRIFMGKRIFSIPLRALQGL